MRAQREELYLKPALRRASFISRRIQMTTMMPTDVNNNPIPAVRLKSSGAHSISVTSSSVRNSSGFNIETQIVSLYATGPVYIKFGDSSVTATSSDHYFPAGVYYDFSIGGEAVSHYTHVAALRVSADCILYISEKE
jgi:hypothetical protein